MENGVSAAIVVNGTGDEEKKRKDNWMPIPEVKLGKPQSTKIGFYVWRSQDGYRWRCIHRNGNIIAESGEAYKSKRGLKRTLENLMAAIGQGDCAIFDQTTG